MRAVCVAKDQPGPWDNEVVRRGSPASGSSAAARSRRGAPLRELQVTSGRVVSLQDNRVSVWSVGDAGSAGLNGEYQGEPQLLCDIRHDGDVMDMQVRELLCRGWSPGTNGLIMS